MVAAGSRGGVRPTGLEEPRHELVVDAADAIAVRGVEPSDCDRSDVAKDGLVGCWKRLPVSDVHERNDDTAARLNQRTTRTLAQNRVVGATIRS